MRDLLSARCLIPVALMTFSSACQQQYTTVTVVTSSMVQEQRTPYVSPGQPTVGSSTTAPVTGSATVRAPSGDTPPARTTRAETSPDIDRDGVPDKADRCPNFPETMNGFEDQDGCPDERPDMAIAKCKAIRTLGYEVDDRCRSLLGDTVLPQKKLGGP